MRKLSPVLGAARDWDVVAPSSPAARKARRAARALVASAAFNQTLVRILRWMEEAPWRTSDEPLAAFATGALERLRRKALKKIDWSNAGQRHRLRIRVRRLRYAADAFVDAFPGSRSYLTALERLQDYFGELNDRAVARRLIDARQHG